MIGLKDGKRHATRRPSTSVLAKPPKRARR
jgi:hypothetical protein